MGAGPERVPGPEEQPSVGPDEDDGAPRQPWICCVSRSLTSVKPVFAELGQVERVDCEGGAWKPHPQGLSERP